MECCNRSIIWQVPGTTWIFRCQSCDTIYYMYVNHITLYKRFNRGGRGLCTDYLIEI